MKKLIFSTCIILGALITQAGPSGSTLRLTVENGTRFSVEINDHYFGGPYAVFNNRLRAGNSFLRVYNRGWGSGQHGLIFEGSVQIPPRSNVEAMIDHHGQFRIIRINTTYGGNIHHNTGHICTYTSQWGRPCLQPYGHYGIHQFHDPVIQYGGNNFNPYQTTCNTVPVGASPVTGFGYGNPGISVMHPAEFASLQNSIIRQSFDDTRVLIMQQALTHNRIESAQVAALMNMLTFDSSKLQFAKYAYEKVVDKRNFYVVNDSFDFSSSVEELLRFLRNG